MKKREAFVGVKLTDKVKGDLQSIADDYGVGVSTLASMVIGQYVHQQKHLLGSLQKGMNTTVKDLYNETVEK